MKGKTTKTGRKTQGTGITALATMDQPAIDPGTAKLLQQLIKMGATAQEIVNRLKD